MEGALRNDLFRCFLQDKENAFIQTSSFEIDFKKTFL